MATWDPEIYRRFADERGRPFVDLTARIAASDPGAVVDLGCGPGELTASLAQRWPSARVVGLDSSPAMIEAAARYATPRVRFEQGDLRRWRPDTPVDVVVCNATLQWVPDHRALWPALLAGVRPGGWLAFQVPGNLAEPSHRILRELAAEEPYAEATADVERPSAADAATYLADLAGLGCVVDAWETTYLHVLTGPDPVFRWIAGTGARPVLQALGDLRRAAFEAEYKRRLRAAYPEQPFGTVLPFRRVFVVARKETP